MEDQDVPDTVDAGLDGGTVRPRGLVGSLNGLSLPVGPEDEVVVQSKAHGLGHLFCDDMHHVLSCKYNRNEHRSWTGIVICTTITPHVDQQNITEYCHWVRQKINVKQITQCGIRQVLLYKI